MNNVDLDLMTLIHEMDLGILQMYIVLAYQKWTSRLSTVEHY